MNTNAPIGTVVLVRHGDRRGFYQAPTSYDPSGTTITPLGEQQEFHVGQLVRERYAQGGQAQMTALTVDEPDMSQINSLADGGGEGSVIFDSAIAFWQGFYPPSNSSSITLANGTTIVSPLGGYQYVGVDALMPSDDISLEGWTDCATFTDETNLFYASDEFARMQTDSQAFLDAVKQDNLVGDRTVTLQNMWNIFDYMNVNSIHDADYAALLNSTNDGDMLAQARALANWHQYNVFTAESASSGAGNIAGRTILPHVLDALQGYADNSTTTLVTHLQISYKPFLSLFNMTNLAAATSPAFPYPDAIVDYASAAIYELREKMDGSQGHDVRFLFRNGSSTSDEFTAYPLFGSDSVDYDLGEFVSMLEPNVIANTTQWCGVCSNTQDRGCDAVAALAAAESSATSAAGTSSNAVSPVGAGFIGAGVTIALVAAVFGALYIFGLVAFRPRRQKKQPAKEIY